MRGRSSQHCRNRLSGLSVCRSARGADGVCRPWHRDARTLPDNRCRGCNSGVTITLRFSYTNVYSDAILNMSLLAISQFDTLFNLIGTTYGGDGQNTFGLPNLQGRIPFHQGTSASGDTLVIGQPSGTETVTLTTNQLPSHTHTLGGNSSAGTQPGPAGGFWAQSSLKAYSTSAPAHGMPLQP